MDDDEDGVGADTREAVAAAAAGAAAEEEDEEAAAECEAGRAWQLLLAMSSLAFSTLVSRHVIQGVYNPRFLSNTA
jgi:hypothetical protein